MVWYVLVGVGTWGRMCWPSLTVMAGCSMAFVQRIMHSGQRCLHVHPGRLGL